MWKIRSLVIIKVNLGEIIVRKIKTTDSKIMIVTDQDKIEENKLDWQEKTEENEDKEDLIIIITTLLTGDKDKDQNPMRILEIDMNKSIFNFNYF
jgi:hypothetical protein